MLQWILEDSQFDSVYWVNVPAIDKELWIEGWWKWLIYISDRQFMSGGATTFLFSTPFKPKWFILFWTIWSNRSYLYWDENWNNSGYYYNEPDTDFLTQNTLIVEEPNFANKEVVIEDDWVRLNKISSWSDSSIYISIIVFW